MTTRRISLSVIVALVISVGMAGISEASRPSKKHGRHTKKREKLIVLNHDDLPNGRCYARNYVPPAPPVQNRTVIYTPPSLSTKPVQQAAATSVEPPAQQ